MPLQKLLFPDEPVTIAIVVVIAAMTAAALIGLCAAGAALRRDRRALARMRGDEVEGEPESSVFRARAGVGAAEADVAVAEALSEQEYAELEARVYWPRFLGNACVFVGLLGTVLGLGLVIGTIDPQSARLKEELSRALAHMGTAFSCTFYGVLGSLLVGGAAHAYQAGVECLCRERDLWLLERAVRGGAGDSQRPEDAAEAMTQAARVVREAVSPFVDALRASSAEILQAAGSFGASSALVYDAAGQLCREVRQIVPLVQAIAEGQQKGEALLQELQQERQAADAQVRELVAPLVGAAKNTADLAEKVAALQTQVGDGVSELGEEVRGVAQQFQSEREEAAKERKTQAAHAAAAVEAMRENVKLTRELLENEKITAAIGDVATRLRETSTQLTAHQEELAKERGRIPESIRNLAGSFDGFSSNLSAGLRQQQEELTRAAQGLQGTLGGLSSLIELVEGSLRDVAPVRAEISCLADGARQGASELRGAAETLRHASSALNEAAAKAAQSRPHPRRGEPEVRPAPPPPMPPPEFVQGPRADLEVRPPGGPRGPRPGGQPRPDAPKAPWWRRIFRRGG